MFTVCFSRKNRTIQAIKYLVVFHLFILFTQLNIKMYMTSLWIFFYLSEQLFKLCFMTRCTKGISKCITKRQWKKWKCISKKDKFKSSHSKFNYECPIVDQMFKHLKGFQSKHLAKISKFGQIYINLHIIFISNWHELLRPYHLLERSHLWRPACYDP